MTRGNLRSFDKRKARPMEVLEDADVSTMHREPKKLTNKRKGEKAKQGARSK